MEPFEKTTLAEAVEPGDFTIRVVDDNFFPCPTLGWIWLENADFTRPNRFRRFLGNGVYELLLAAGTSFAVGDGVIRPHRHIYNTLPHSTSYGVVNKETMLKAAVISYKAQEEVRRYNPFIDPLDT